MQFPNKMVSTTWPQKVISKWRHCHPNRSNLSPPLPETSKACGQKVLFNHLQLWSSFGFGMWTIPRLTQTTVTPCSLPNLYEIQQCITELFNKCYRPFFRGGKGVGAEVRGRTRSHLFSELSDLNISAHTVRFRFPICWFVSNQSIWEARLKPNFALFIQL